MSFFDKFRKYPPFPSPYLKVGQEDVNPFECREPEEKFYRFSAKVGRPIEFNSLEHGSVGIWINVEFDESYFELNTYGASGPNCPCGGDAFIKRWIFNPKKRGITNITMNHSFRGPIVKIEKFEIEIN